MKIIIQKWSICFTVDNRPIIIYIWFPNTLKSFSVQIQDRHSGAINVNLDGGTPDPYTCDHVDPWDIFYIYIYKHITYVGVVGRPPPPPFVFVSLMCPTPKPAQRFFVTSPFPNTVFFLNKAWFFFKVEKLWYMVYLCHTIRREAGWEERICQTGMGRWSGTKSHRANKHQCVCTRIDIWRSQEL
jgi:hypothetical protein